MHPILRVFGAVILLSLPLNAQTAPEILPHSGEGTEFWLCFQKNFRSEIVDEASQATRPAAPLTLSITLTSQFSTTVLVEIPGIDFSRKVALGPGSVQTIQIPPVAEVTGSDYLERLAVHITADAPVSAIALNTRAQTTDTYSGIPVEALGTAYRVACYRMLQNDLLAQLAVVATQDSTIVRIVPTSAIETREPSRYVDPHAARASVPQNRRPDSARMRPRNGDAELAEISVDVPPEAAARRDSMQRVMKERRKSADSLRASMETRRREMESRRGENAERPRSMAVTRDSVRPGMAVSPRGEAQGRYERPMAKPRKAAGQASVAGDTITVRLSRGEVYQLLPRPAAGELSDLTGTLVESNRPVAVFSGHNCAYVPDISVKACNVLSEQIAPIAAWGRRHVVGRLKERSSSVVRIVASAEGTEITINGSPVLDREGKRVQLRAGKWHEMTDVKGHLEIVTSRPALVVQYSTGYANGDNIGDPMMIVVPPVEQFGTVFTTATIAGPDWRHYVNVIAPNESLKSLSIDGDVVDATLFSKLAGSELSIGAVPLTSGHHVFASSAPFGFYSYGFNSNYDAYGHGGGQLYEDLQAGNGGKAGSKSSPEIGSLNEGR